MTIDEIMKHVSITEIKGDCVRIKPNDGYMLKLGDFYTDELYCEKSAIPDDLTIVSYNTYFIENNKEKFKGKTVGEAKEMLIADIEAYDTSSAVNGFVLNGQSVWLDKATRVGLMNSTTIAKAMGNDTTVLWLGDMRIEVGCDKAIQLLSALEMYALECFNVTAAHRKAVSALGSVEDVEAFDVTEGYPDRLSMTV